MAVGEMSDKSLEHLRLQPLLQGMSDEHLSIIKECSTSICFKKGEFLLRYRHDAKNFFLLEGGQVAQLDHVPSGALNVVETLVAPTVIGWSWLVAPYRWHFSVKANVDCECSMVDTKALYKKMDNDKAFALEIYKRFMSVVVDRLQAGRLQCMDIYSNPITKDGV